MRTLKFKTNINCGSCIRAVTPHLNKHEGISAWQVDTDNPEKILEVKTDTLDADKIRDIVEQAGFKAENI